MAESFTSYETMPGHLARRFQQIAVAVFQAQMERIGAEITPVQYAALMAVAASPRIDQARLAAAIGFDRATINGVIDRLDGKGLLSRTTSALDRRVRELTITPSGEDLLARIQPAVHAAQDQMVSGLESDEVSALLALLRKAVDGANELSRAPKRG